MAEVATFSTISGDAPDQGVIDILENLLHRAKTGNLRAIAYAIVNSDRSLGTGWAGAAGSRDRVSSAIMILNSRYPLALAQDSR